MITASRSGEECGVLVIRMCAGVEHAGGGLQPPEQLRETGGPDVVSRPDLCGGNGSAGEKTGRQHNREKSAAHRCPERSHRPNCTVRRHGVGYAPVIVITAAATADDYRPK